MGAGSKFEEPIALIGQPPAEPGSTVMVCGPLNFHGDDVSADVTIRVVQPGRGKGTNTKTFVNANHDGNRSRLDDEDAQEWMIPVEIHAEEMTRSVRERGWTHPDFAFIPAPPATLAHGNGSITYHRDDGTAQPPKPWTQADIRVE
jgi:hypothetical protein